MLDNQNPFHENEEENIETKADENDINPYKEGSEEDKKEEPSNDETIEEKIPEENLEEENSQEDKKYEELNNKYIRLAADFDNFRKRTIQEKEELSKYTTVELLKKLTGVLDTFDRAQEHLKNIDNCETVKNSYEVAYKQFVDTLKKIGLNEIEALGQEFNPNEHEAITQVPTDEYAPDTVAVVAQKGYKFEDKIVRPAVVGVAKEKE